MTKDLTQGEPAKLILFFTLPLLLGNIFQQLYTFVDTLIVGRFLGVEALAAVGCVGPLMFLMFGFIMGFTSGLTIYTGQRFGARDEAGVRRSVAACLVLSLLVSVVLMTLSLLICRWLLALMNTPEEIFAGAYAFICIIYGGMFLFVILQTLGNLLRALGDSRTPTMVMAFGLSLNIVFEIVAICVLGFGIPGAAVATLCAQSCGSVVLFFYIKHRLPWIHPQRGEWHPDLHFYWQHLRLALPMGFQESIIAIGAIILQAALNGLGAEAVAAFAAAQKAESVAMMPMMSFGVTMAAYTAQNYGARQFARIGEGVKKCAFMSVGFALVSGGALIAFGRPLMRVFVGAGAEVSPVVEMGELYFLTNCSMYFILALLFVFRFTLQGLGKSFVPTLAGVMELVMRTIAALFLAKIWGYIGVCLASPLAWIGSCVPLAIAFFLTWRDFRRRKPQA